MGIKESDIDIIENVIERFKLTEDYRIKRNEYLVLVSKIKSQAILQLFNELEALVCKKSNIEYEHIVFLGKNTQQKDNAAYADGSMEFDFKFLNRNLIYARTAQLILELKQKIVKSYSAVNNFQHIDVVKSIFQIYDSLNNQLYKLIYAAVRDENPAKEATPLQADCDSDLSMISIGKKMQYCRKALNYTQKEMGIMFNLDRTIISNYENGKYLPSLNFIIQFARYLNINLEDLCYIDFDIKMFEIKYPPTHFIKNAG